MSLVGYFPGARIVAAHPARVGASIDASGIIVHTTDTLKGSLAAIVRSCSTTPGHGECFHAIIPANPSDGPIVQVIAWDRNSNHAGGQDHGLYGGVHPNSCNVGIELEAPGYLKRNAGGAWIHPDTGHVIPDAEVYVDARGRGWGKITDYQLSILASVLDWAVPQLNPTPLGAVTTTGTLAANGVAWAACPLGARVTGHATSNPVQKTDPGPGIMAWLAARGYR